jgi:tRNA (guanine37-N1)-methyltransferase
MRVSVLTIFPGLFEPFLSTSLVGKAMDGGLLAVEVRDLRDFAGNRHRTVDDVPYGGGGGMVMAAPPWLRAVRELDPERRARRVLLSPQGARLDEAKVRQLAGLDHLLLLCARYEGIDERVLELEVDEELSIGDYVVAGGELPAMVLIEAISRQIPGVVGLPGSVEQDSFRRGLLDCPHYTRPAELEGHPVPEVLLSGNHEAIVAWREEAALAATSRKRPDLLARAELSEGQRALLARLAAREARK